MVQNLYTKKELMSILGIGRTQLWKEEKEGKIKPIYVGKRPRYTSEAIHNYLINCTNKKDSAATES